MHEFEFNLSKLEMEVSNKRHELSWTLRKFADHCMCGKDTIQRIEKSQINTNKMTIGVFLGIVNFLDLPVADFFNNKQH